jgi:DNA (cytosine-5)-methyltransferase 1
VAIAYYNEIDPDAALVLKALIDDGVIAPGDVDTRSIKDVQPDDLRPYRQCHFFAGGGLWSVAARLAGWPDERELWTGSCPCQPFSVAGKGGGTDDVRHLWPDFFRLIGARRPAVVVGEQVAGKAGYGWLDGVRADLAGEGYAGRGVDIPACAVDAPHIRQRLYWVALADADCGGRAGRTEDAQRRPIERAAAERPDDVEHTSRIGRGEGRAQPELRGGRAAAASTDASVSDVGHSLGAGLEGHTGDGDGGTERAQSDRSASATDDSVLGNADHDLVRAGARGVDSAPGPDEAATSDEGWHGDSPRYADAHHGRNGSWWADHEWLTCHDGKARRTQPGTPLLVDGLPGRVGLWRIAGNAISPVLAAEVIGALMDVHQADRP